MRETKRQPSRFASLSLSVLVAAAAAVPAVTIAEATETTRAQYVEAVEPICKANTQANERILAGARSRVQQGQLKAASAQFARAGRALKRTVSELAAVPRPQADAQRLKSWLGYLSDEAGLLERTSIKLRHGDKVGAARIAVRLPRVVTLANRKVLPFEFEYCYGDPSRFT